MGVAAALEMQDGVIENASLGLTGAASCASRLTAAEEALVGKPPSAETIAAAAGKAGDGIGDLNDDLHGSAEYRQAMVPVFARRALEAAVARVNES